MEPDASAAVICRSVSESVEDGADVHDEGGGDEPDEPRGGLGSGPVAGASQGAEPDLHDHHHGRHQEDAADDGAHGGGQHPEPEQAGVDVGVRVVGVLGVDEVDRELEALRDEAGEEEGGEGDHLEDQQGPRHVGPGVAGRVAGEAAELAGGREGEAHEDGHREERVHVDHPVQRRHVHARRVRRQRRRELPLVAVVLAAAAAVAALVRSGTSTSKRKTASSGASLPKNKGLDRCNQCKNIWFGFEEMNLRGREVQKTYSSMGAPGGDWTGCFASSNAAVLQIELLLLVGMWGIKRKMGMAFGEPRGQSQNDRGDRPSA